MNVFALDSQYQSEWLSQMQHFSLLRHFSSFSAGIFLWFLMNVVHHINYRHDLLTTNKCEVSQY